MDSENFFRDDLDERPVMVTIRCIAYNQEKYIRETLESFVNQKTDFRFEAIVHDDASTDGTADIIREYADKYPSIIKPIFETENQYSKFDGSLQRIMAEHTRGKYLAYCEGDDYWTDPLKLQKQVDFLETNPEYGMTYGKVRKFIQRTGKFSNIFGGKNCTVEQLMDSNTIPTPTVMLRCDLLHAYNKEVEFHPNWKMGDYPMWLFIAIKSKVHFSDEITACYRVLGESASHSNNYKQRVDFSESFYMIQKWFNDKYKILDPSLVEEKRHSRLFSLAIPFNKRNNAFHEFAQLKKKRLKHWAKLFLVIFHLGNINEIYSKLSRNK